MYRVFTICALFVVVHCYPGYPSAHGGSEDLGGSSGGDLGDYHGGVSIIAGGSGGQGKHIDLTHHGKDNHHGAYGGTFISSSKYNHAEGHEGHNPGVYASVLGASSSSSGLGASSGHQIEVHEDLSDIQEALHLAGHH